MGDRLILRTIFMDLLINYRLWILILINVNTFFQAQFCPRIILKTSAIWFYTWHVFQDNQIKCYSLFQISWMRQRDTSLLSVNKFACCKFAITHKIIYVDYNTPYVKQKNIVIFFWCLARFKGYTFIFTLHMFTL